MFDELLILTVEDSQAPQLIKLMLERGYQLSEINASPKSKHDITISFEAPAELINED